jgi:hypothetical protein
LAHALERQGSDIAELGSTIELADRPQGVPDGLKFLAGLAVNLIVAASKVAIAIEHFRHRQIKAPFRGVDLFRDGALVPFVTPRATERPVVVIDTVQMNDGASRSFVMTIAGAMLLILRKLPRNLSLEPLRLEVMRKL